MGLLLYIVSVAALVFAVCRSAAPVGATFRSRLGIGLWGGCVFLLPAAYWTTFPLLLPALVVVAGLGAALTILTLERDRRALIILLVVGLSTFAIGLMAWFPLFLLVPA